jgi:exodeoxyribonuclease VII large subunit
MSPIDFRDRIPQASASSAGASAQDAAAIGGPDALTVTAAMNMAKGALESVTITVVGEVSEVSVKPGYKAAYFTIKDASSSLPCMMWNNRYRASGVDLQIGQLVQLTGRFTLYVAKGRMNFDVFSISLAGEGNLRLQVANLAKKLQAEGLTDRNRKKPLPKYPDTIGVVTSPRGAAVHDVLRTLRRRYPLARVLVAGVPVEGAGAPAAIVDGIKCVYDAGAEVILVVRGGGSFEDLMPFNDERLARTIAACPMPVVTGIGHEPDTSIADMVSDFRASTPTAAAEAVSPAPEELDSYIVGRAGALRSSLERSISKEATHLQSISTRPAFVDPMYLMGDYAQALDIRAERLSRAIPVGLDRDERRLQDARRRLAQTLPSVIARYEDGLSNARMRFVREGSDLLSRFEREAAMSASRLDDLSPLKTLSRGYAVARNAQGEVVKSTSQIAVGGRLSVMVSDGLLDCDVVDVRENA